MNELEKMIHWDSTLMALNPNMIREYPAIITGTLMRDNDIYNSELFIDVTRNQDSLERKLYLTFSEYDFDGNKIPVEEKDKKILPEVIRNLFTDFKVEDESQLIKKPVIALYFGNAIVGIQRT